MRIGLGATLALPVTNGHPIPTVNLFRYSQQIDNATAWGTDATGTVTANNVTAPDATLTADTLTLSAVGGYVTQVFTATAGQPHTVSMYYPAGGTAPFAVIQINTVAGAATISLNRATGAVSAQTTFSGTLTLTGGSASDGAGGRRFWVTFTPLDANPVCYFRVGDTINGADGAIGRTLPMWQGQAVAGITPGPIILRTI